MSDISNIHLDGNQLIEASAGTGKTYTITNLFIRLLLGRDEHWGRPLAIQEILVLTFTIAATDELKHRISTRINQTRLAYQEPSDDEFLRHLVATSEDPAADLKLLTAAIQLMDEASIFTIHGFCARVLGEQAFDAGSLFNLEMDADRDHLLQLAAEDCFRSEILTLPYEQRSIALTIWKHPDQLAKSARALLFRGELQFYPELETLPDIDEIRNQITNIKTQWLTDDSLTQQLKTNLAKNRRPVLRLEQMKEFCESPSIDLTNELWEVYSNNQLEAARLSKGVIPTTPVLDEIEYVYQYIAKFKANLWHRIVRVVSDNMSVYKSAGSNMTVDDLLTSLQSAIQNPESPLIEVVRKRWPVAMIDEFQDTDSIQYDIFSSIYPVSSPHGAMLMIGDPKQAIYNFRGADIFTYINARRDISERHHLSVNWRSTPAMIAAVNYLFQKPGIFGNDEDIPFIPAETAEPNLKKSFQVAEKNVPAVQFFTVQDANSWINVSDARKRTMREAANLVADLIRDGSPHRAGDKPVDPGEIAILVRSRDDAAAAQQALKQLGLQSVYLTLESVFLQDTAADLKLVLEAILEPGNDTAIRSALATRLMQTDANDIERLGHDIKWQQQVLTEFRQYHDLWLTRGIAPTLNRLIENRKLATNWLTQIDGERQMTNLRHLIELLQRQEKQAPAMYQLIKWFSQEQYDAETVSVEERQLRLESDQNLIKIVTMHAAKGLEYDVVLIPMPVFYKHTRERKREPALFHENHSGRYQAAVEFGDNVDHRNSSAAESDAEDMRLLYVAITRARYRCYIGMPKISGINGSAFATLLGTGKVDKSDDLGDTLANCLPDDLFSVHPESSQQAPVLDQAEELFLQQPPTKPNLSDQWRIHSYSSVASRLPHKTHTVAGFLDDDVTEESAAATSLRTKHQFPRGARVGVALHALLEDIDFTDQASFEPLCERTLLRLGLTEDWMPVLLSWLEEIVTAPMAGYSLCDIPRGERMDELEFYFPLSASEELSEYLTAENLIAPNSDPLYLDGLMTGLIDMVYRVDHQFYICDYKSNYLGPDEAAYQVENLHQAMSDNQYHLQYLFYTVALHRYLSNKMSDYSYTSHFGGVNYLFLRGMNPNSSAGIYFTRPEFDQIATLDRLLTDGLTP